MIRPLDSNFANCKSTTIQQAVPHFCKGDIFQNWIIALPVGESNCDIILTKKFETSKSIINDHSKEGSLMSMKLSEKYFFLGFESGIQYSYNTTTRGNVSYEFFFPIGDVSNLAYIGGWRQKFE